MCPPAEFDVTYSINPWMDPSQPVDPRLAYLQWQRIHDLHVELGHTVDLIEPLPGLPDMVFAANGATVHDGRVLVAREVSELLRAGGGVKCCTLELGPARERAAGTASGLTVVVTSVASDSHTWNLVYLQLALEELGHQVVNLGACVPDDLLVTECLRIRPDLVVVSTVNGHGFHDGRRLISRSRDCAELAEMPVVIGGKLGIAGPAGHEGRDQLRAAGFDAVFEEGAAITALTSMAGQLTAGVRT